MKKRSIKIVALVMSLVLLFGAGSAVSAVKPANDVEKILFDATDYLVNGVADAVASVIPAPLDWIDKADYKSAFVPEGTEKFLTKPADDAKWLLGYSQASILEGQQVIGKNHYVAGGISLSPKYPTEIIDDSKVRVIALDDSSGRGITVFAVVDAYGLANKDVREIRSRLSAFAKEKNIVSINVAVLHQHSVVDTFGMNGNILGSIVLNPINNLLSAVGGDTIAKDYNGKNEEFMNNLFKVTADTVERAVAQMEPGTLKFGTVDASDYVTDKRAPYALDENLNRFRFIPDDANSRETWFSTSVIHCVGNGVQGTQITGDYPYYMEEYINDKEKANFMLLLGAELSTSQDKSTCDIPEGTSRIDSIKIYGAKLGEVLASVKNEKDVAPLLNIRHKEVTFKVTNRVMYLAAKAGLFENQALVTKDGIEVVSEIGYCEIGTDLAIALIPGELEASIAYGGGLGAKDSWSGTEWKYHSMQRIVGKDRKLLVFGICNDQIGYIVPTNDYMPMLHEDSKSVEFVSLGSQTAVTFIKEFDSLVKGK